MSSKRSSTAQGNQTNEDFNLNLLQLLSNNKKTKKRNAAKLLDETCSHIKRLNGEVDDLSNRISELMASSETNDHIDADILSQLVQQ